MEQSIATEQYEPRVMFPAPPIEGSSMLAGAVAGAVAGVAASLVMNLFQSFITNIFEDRERDSAHHEHGAQQQKTQPEAHKRGTARQDKPATIIAAERISKAIRGHGLKRDEQELAGNIMHYLMGAVSGAIYGAAAERSEIAKTGFGTAFGSAVWLIGDEITVPALGLAKPPTEYPWHVHAKSLAAHWVFGASTEVVRRVMRGK